MCKELEEDRTYHFDCQCSSPEHIIRFVYSPPFKDDGPEIYTEVQLCQPRNFFEKIWVALKYIFGYKCKYGHWDCWIMKSEDLSRFKDMLDRFEIDRKAWIARMVKKTDKKE